MGGGPVDVDAVSLWGPAPWCLVMKQIVDFEAWHGTAVGLPFQLISILELLLEAGAVLGSSSVFFPGLGRRCWSLEEAQWFGLGPASSAAGEKPHLHLANLVVGAESVTAFSGFGEQSGAFIVPSSRRRSGFSFHVWDRTDDTGGSSSSSRAGRSGAPFWSSSSRSFAKKPARWTLTLKQIERVATLLEPSDRLAFRRGDDALAQKVRSLTRRFV